MAMTNGFEMSVEAELAIPAARAQVVQFRLGDPSNHVMQRRDRYWIDLCLTPRPLNARACYREHWGPHRFERMGDMFLVPPGEAVHVRADAAGVQSSIICELDGDAVSRWLGIPIDWNDRRLAASLDISSGTIRHLLRRLAEEARSPGFGSEVLVECVAGQLAIELGRYYEGVADAPASGGLASWRLRLIEERLREVRQPPTLEELATLCSLSVRQLTRGFRASRGCSIGDHIVQSRIESAKRLLGGGESVKAIAYSIGFSSTSSFSYAFRRATGLTPRQFRQRLLMRMMH